MLDITWKLVLFSTSSFVIEVTGSNSEFAIGIDPNPIASKMLSFDTIQYFEDLIALSFKPSLIIPQKLL